MSYGRNYSWILQKCFLSCGYCDTALYKAIFFDNGPLFFKISIIYKSLENYVSCNILARDFDEFVPRINIQTHNYIVKKVNLPVCLILL